MDRYRLAWLVTGVRVPLQPTAHLPVAIVPMPELRVAAALGEQMTLALARVGFVTEVRGPSWMASVEASRPPAVLVVGPVGLHQDSWQVLSASAQRALDLSVLLHGSTPQVLAGVLEVEQARDVATPAWRTLLISGSSGAWPVAPLLRRLPDGAAAPALAFDDGWQALDGDPRLRVWLSLARSATEHDSADLRVLQRATLLETIGKATIPPDRILRTPDGRSSRRPKYSRDRPSLHEWLFAVLQQALRSKPELSPAVLPRSASAWDACGTWSGWRNAVAHEGLLNPSSDGEHKAKVQKVLEAALAVPGVSSTEEGLAEYDQALAATVELVLLQHAGAA